MNAAATPIRHVILDRDGVLNRERNDGRWIDDWSQWRWIDGAREALALLTRAGIRISVATNQSGIGRGSVTRAAVAAIHARMQADAVQAGAVIHRVWVCPHAPEAGCDCRKPLPGLLLRAIEASGIPAAATLAVGDDRRDLEAAWAAGVRAALVRSGKGRATAATLRPGRAAVFDDLAACVGALLPHVPSGVAQPQ